MSKGDQVRFDGRVAIVTGAGGGLGKAYALLLASRGAKVVVNDLGTSHKGEGHSAKAADVVVNEIKSAGGEAVANYDSVEHGDKIVKTAIDAFGRVDIVINNAGILRDVSFVKMKQEDWDIIYKVHLLGAYSVTKAAWNYMREQNYGRIIMTASAAGLFGNFGQANYSSMKLALLGFANTLALEGASKNIYANTIAPVAGTRMTATVMPPDLVEALKPEYVAPLVAYLCSEKSEENGGAFEVGAGWVSKIRFERTQGQFFNVSKGFTPEQIRDNWERVTDFTDATHPATTSESLSTIVAGLTKAKEAAQSGLKAQAAAGKKGNDSIPDPDALVGHKFAPSTYTITPKDVALYALATGAARADPVDPVQLNFVYENSQDFAALPSMGAIFPFSAMAALLSVPGLSFNPMMLLHGEQYLEIRNPIPTSGTLTNTAYIKNLYDKGKNAVITIAAETRDEQGKDVVYNEYSVFIRGIGGFGGDRGPTGDANVPPSRAPDVVHKEKTSFNEALIYRLASGDMNPLHADPSMAAIGGLEKPILHGLCSFAYASRAVLHHFCNNDPTKFKSIRVRFSKHVFPGETIVTEMWKTSPTTVVVRAKVEERDEVCLSNAVVEIASADAPAPAAAAPASGAASDFEASAQFANLNSVIEQGGAALVKQVNGIYQFDVKKGKNVRSWGIDLKTGPVGKIIDGKPDKPGITISISDDDLVDMFNGDLEAQSAFLEGKLTITGDMGLALRLKNVVKAKARL